MGCPSELSPTSLGSREEAGLKGQGWWQRGTAPEGARHAAGWLMSTDSARAAASLAPSLLRGGGFVSAWLLLPDNLRGWKGIQSSVGLSANQMHSSSLQLALISSAFNLALNFGWVSLCCTPPQGDGRQGAEGGCLGQLKYQGACLRPLWRKKKDEFTDALIYFLLWRTSWCFYFSISRASG